MHMQAYHLVHAARAQACANDVRHCLGSLDVCQSDILLPGILPVVNSLNCRMHACGAVHDVLCIVTPDFGRRQTCKFLLSAPAAVEPSQQP